MKIQVTLKYDKKNGYFTHRNNGYFTQRNTYICDILLNSSWNEKCFGQKLCKFDVQVTVHRDIAYIKTN